MDLRFRFCDSELLDLGCSHSQQHLHHKRILCLYHLLADFVSARQLCQDWAVHRQVNGGMQRPHRGRAWEGVKRERRGCGGGWHAILVWDCLLTLNFDLAHKQQRIGQRWNWVSYHGNRDVLDARQPSKYQVICILSSQKQICADISSIVWDTDQNFVTDF